VPEGDTVWRAARQLDAALAGRPLVAADLRVPRHATADLVGRTVVATASRGKHLLTRLDGGLTLHSHLGMEGSWRTYPAGRRWPGPAWQIRAVLQTAETTAVGYRLPRLDLLRTGDEARVVGHLGPDVLGADWDVTEAVRRLRADPAREVGDALLDQRNLAGIGNVYKAEALFATGVSPWLPVGQVPDLDLVVRTAHAQMTRNRDVVRRVTTDGPGSPRHWVFERAGRPCRRCGTIVSAARQGEQQRMTYWCRRCQPGPDPAG